MEIEYTPPPDHVVVHAVTYTFEVLKFAVSQTTESDTAKLLNAGFTAEQIAAADDNEISIRKVKFFFELTPEDGGEPMKASETLNLIPKMMWKLKQFRVACGFDDPEGKAVRFNLEDFQSKTGIVKVSVKKKVKGDGEFNDFTWVRPSTEPF